MLALDHLVSTPPEPDTGDAVFEAVIGSPHARGVLLVGVMGVGKTTAALGAARRARDVGCDVVWLQGDAGRHDRGLAAITDAMPEVQVPPSTSTALRVLHRQLRQARGGVTLLVIDDVASVDDYSLALAADVALEQESVRLVMTSRAGRPIPAAVNRLLITGLLQHQRIDALPVERVGALAERALGGPLHGESAHRLFAWTGGVPLLIARQLQSCQQDPDLTSVDGLWQLPPVLRAPSGLGESLLAEAESIHPRGAAVIEHLAVAGPCRPEDVEGTTDGSALDALEVAGLVTYEVRSDGSTPDLRASVPPIVAAAVRTAVPSGRTLDLLLAGPGVRLDVEPSPRALAARSLDAGALLHEGALARARAVAALADGDDLACRSIALMAAAEQGDLPPLEPEERRWALQAVHTPEVPDRWLFAAALTVASLLAGRPRTSAGWASTALRTNPAPDLVTWLETMRAHSLACIGLLDAARAALGRAGADARCAGHAARARAQILAVEGDVDGAVAVLAAAARSAHADGRLVAEWSALHDQVRLGRATEGIVSRLDALRDGTPLHDARADHARALLEGDLDALVGVATALVDMGVAMYGFEAFAQAAELAGRRGDQRRANRLLTETAARVEACEGARSPALDLLAAAPSLTGREVEVATLSAEGMAAKEVGARLGITWRSVDNNLHRVYSKLGIGGRDELATQLATLGIV
ncbi:MAG TPA: LuxR C-terminal-related transcriptional regulator [Iamia sp.]